MLAAADKSSEPMQSMMASAPAGDYSGSDDCQGVRYRLAGNPSHVAIVGLGRSGLSCAEFLAGIGLEVDVYDAQSMPALAGELQERVPEARLHSGSIRIDRWREDSLLVVSPGVPLSHPDLLPLLESGVRPVGDIELFAQCAVAPVIAITGSNGKSTVTQLTGEMLSAAGLDVRVGGNIGVPVLDLLDLRADCYVLELSSFQLETTWSLKPQCATVLNLAADHMDRYAGMDGYVEAKAKIYHGSGTMLINVDDERCRALAQADRKTLAFSSSAPSTENEYGILRDANATWLMRGTAQLADSADIRLPGQHNLMNVLAAWALAHDAGIDDEIIREAAASFCGLPHRMEWLGSHAGLDWINDSKGTNVGAAAAAIDGLDGPLVLIAGGQGKGADFAPLAGSLGEKVRGVVLMGEDADRIAHAIAGSRPVEFADSMSDAVNLARSLAQPGDTVLLSPACASFDMYSGFEARGDDFRRCVEEIA